MALAAFILSILATIVAVLAAVFHGGRPAPPKRL
jgi:hypothetical protein